MNTAEDRTVDEWLDPQTVRDFTLEDMRLRYRKTRCWHFWRMRWRFGSRKKRMCAVCYTGMIDRRRPVEGSPAIAGICLALGLSALVIMLGIGVGMLLKALI